MSTSLQRVFDNDVQRQFLIQRTDKPALRIMISVSSTDGKPLSDDSDPIVCAGLQGFTDLSLDEIYEVMHPEESQRAS